MVTLELMPARGGSGRYRAAGTVRREAREMISRTTNP